MPLKRKLIDVGGSRAVCLPADWLKFHEDKMGHKIENILLEINGVIRISVDETEKIESPDLPIVQEDRSPIAKTSPVP
jgi:hypothetical protein